MKQTGKGCKVLQSLYTRISVLSSLVVAGDEELHRNEWRGKEIENCDSDVSQAVFDDTVLGIDCNTV